MLAPSFGLSVFIIYALGSVCQALKNDGISEQFSSVCNCKSNPYSSLTLSDTLKLDYKVCRFEIKFTAMSAGPYVFFGVELNPQHIVGLECSFETKARYVEIVNGTRVAEPLTYMRFLYPMQEVNCDMDTGFATIHSDFYSAILYNFNTTLPVHMTGDPALAGIKSSILDVVF